MIKGHGSNERGFSLIELLIVMGMLSIVLTAVYSLYETQSKSAQVQDCVVEVQQNLRIGMDQMTRDLRMAGYLACPSPLSAANPPTDNTGLGGSDTITTIMSGGSGRSAKIIALDPPSGGTTVVFTVDSAEDVDQFTGEQSARIIDPDVLGIKPPEKAADVYAIVSTDRAAKTITLSGLDPNAKIYAGDMLVDAKSNLDTLVKYCLGSSKDAACPAATCPDGQNCLVRTEVVNGVPKASVVASTITNLQLRYIDKQGPESDVPSNIAEVRAVRVMIAGQCVTPSSGIKTREMASLVDLRNAQKPCPKP